MELVLGAFGESFARHSPVPTTAASFNVAHLTGAVVEAIKSIYFLPGEDLVCFSVYRQTMAALASLPLGGIVLHDLHTLPPLAPCC